MTVLRKTTAEHPAAAAERLQALLSKKISVCMNAAIRQACCSPLFPIINNILLYITYLAVLLHMDLLHHTIYITYFTIPYLYICNSFTLKLRTGFFEIQRTRAALRLERDPRLNRELTPRSNLIFLPSSYLILHSSFTPPPLPTL